MLLKALEARFKVIPEDIVAAIQGCNDPNKFEGWLEHAVLAPTIDDFRRALKEG